MKKKTIKELTAEVRQEGLFSEAIEISRRKKTYKIASLKEGILIAVYFILALILITAIKKYRA